MRKTCDQIQRFLLKEMRKDQGKNRSCNFIFEYSGFKGIESLPQTQIF